MKNERFLEDYEKNETIYRVAKLLTDTVRSDEDIDLEAKTELMLGLGYIAGLTGCGKVEDDNE